MLVLAFIYNSCYGLVLISTDNCEVGLGPRSSVCNGLVRHLVVPFHVLELLMSNFET